MLLIKKNVNQLRYKQIRSKKQALFQKVKSLKDDARKGNLTRVTIKLIKILEAKCSCLQKQEVQLSSTIQQLQQTATAQSNSIFRITDELKLTTQKCSN